MTTETTVPDALLPCAHCGSSAQVDWCDGFPYVRCTGCGCGTMMHMSQDERQPIAAWNRRAGQSHADAGLLEALEGVMPVLDGFPMFGVEAATRIERARAAIAAAKGAGK